jgi:cytidylate kinase
MLIKKGMPKTDVITIDGPAGSGKSTVSRLVAKKLNRIYLDTGAMYRAAALAASRKGISFSDGKRLGELCRSLKLYFTTDEDPPRIFLGTEDISMAIRAPVMDMLSSTVSSVEEVREAMMELQRKMAEGTCIVAEGRDMGTVVFPEARHKFFLTASPEARAERRYKELVGRKESVSREVVKAELNKRDHQDKTRSLAPLKPATNAKLIDSTDLTPDEVVSAILEDIKSEMY